MQCFLLVGGSLLYNIIVSFVIHWNESAMDLHVFPIPIPPPISLSTRSLCIFPVHQVWVLVSCIQPGLVICFTLDNIHVSMLFSWNTPPSSSLRVQKSVLYICVSFSVLQTNVIFIPCACHDKFGKISTSLVNLHTYNFWGTGRWHAAYG